MRKVKTDNSDLIQYLDTVKELKIIFRQKNTEMNIVNYALIIFRGLRLKI